MKVDELERRNKILNGFLMALFFCVAVFIIAIGFNIEKPTTVKSDIFEGAIFTCDGTILTDFKNLDSSNPEKQHSRSLLYPDPYSSLLGYNSTKYNTSGIRKRYETWLYSGRKNQNGKDITLALNHHLQVFSYDILKDYNKNGSIVIIENETGAIKALVSTKESGTFNANEVDSLHFSRLPSGFLIGEYEKGFLAGSTFKALSAIALIENGNDDYKYNDKTGYISYGGGIIHNANNSIKGTLDLRNSLKESANVYYVAALENEGFYDQLKDVAERFKIGEEISLDFCTLSSSFDYAPTNDFQKALAVFGQGNESSITPIHNAMIFGCIMNDNGNMMKPYIVETNTNRSFFDYIFNTNLTVKPEVIAKNVISKKTAKQIKEALEYTAVEGYGLPKGCIAKSGTAQLSNGKNQLWLCAATEDYSICISMTSQGYSSSLIKPMKNILDFIENNGI